MLLRLVLLLLHVEASRIPLQRHMLPRSLSVRRHPALQGDIVDQCSYHRMPVSCPEFVQLIASEANTISEEEKKKTLNPEHVVKALDRLGFSSFATDVSQFLEEVKENDKECKPLVKLSFVFYLQAYEYSRGFG